MKEIAIGTLASASVSVDESTLACTVGSGSLRVFSTPMLAAVMEQAACKALAPYLEGDETTVGTALSIAHTAATPPGMTVTARAEVTEVNGREICFSITARDEAGEVGTAEHRRFLVFGQRFEQKAEGRKA